MLSIVPNEYLLFVANYFKIDPQTILRKSIEQSIISPDDSIDLISSKLQARIGFQRRLLEPLSVVFTKSSPIDTIVFLYKFIVFPNHFSLLIADSENVFRLLFFYKTPEVTFPSDFGYGSILKIDSCHVKDGALVINQIPRVIWFYDFPKVFAIREYHLDNLPECIYDETYTKITNFVTVMGYFLHEISKDKVFCYLYSKELQIRIIPYKIIDLNPAFSTKFVKISFCELEYGPDAYQLKLSEFSTFTVLSSIPYSIATDKFKSLLRFEYPTIRMSLSELTDKTVACTKVRFLTVDYHVDTWKFFGYDSSLAFCLTVFDSLFGEHLANSISEKHFFLMDGIFRIGSKYFTRERLDTVQLLSCGDDNDDGEDDVSVPVTNPDDIIDNRLIITDLFITEILEKTYLSRENKFEKYEKIRGVCFDNPISVNNYNAGLFQKLFVGQKYRLFFVHAKYYKNNLFFSMDSNSHIKHLNS